MAQLEEKLIAGIRDYFRRNGFRRAVVGLSGGIDSCLSALLVSRAIGSKNLAALIMPETGVSSASNIKDAEEWAKKLKLRYFIIPINKYVHAFQKQPWQQTDSAKINLKARIRAVLLYSFANSDNALVIGTGNKSELTLGYFTKYGDGAADLFVIGELFKTEVRALAAALGLPEKIINKTPSAELYAHQADEKELGAGYDEIDKILEALEQEAIQNKELVKKGLAKRIIERVKKNEHKRLPPPIIKI